MVLKNANRELEMYLGRIVVAGMTPDGRAVAAYRVSSRSFPNRSAKLANGIVSIMPRPGHEGDLSKNPYIAYNSVRTFGRLAVATNGSHTDPIAEKLATGMSLRDAFALSLLAMDYEHDSLSTPRVAAAVDAEAKVCVLGIVRKDALLVKEFALKPGEALYLSTYEKDSPCSCNLEASFSVKDAASACDHVIEGGVFASFEKPVTAAAAVWTGSAYELAVADAKA